MFRQVLRIFLEAQQWFRQIVRGLVGEVLQLLGPAVRFGHGAGELVRPRADAPVQFRVAQGHRSPLSRTVLRYGHARSLEAVP